MNMLASAETKHTDRQQKKWLKQTTETLSAISNRIVVASAATETLLRASCSRNVLTSAARKARKPVSALDNRDTLASAATSWKHPDVSSNWKRRSLPRNKRLRPVSVKDRACLRSIGVVCCSRLRGGGGGDATRSHFRQRIDPVAVEFHRQGPISVCVY